jgi:hypothetical protein
MYVANSGQFIGSGFDASSCGTGIKQTNASSVTITGGTSNYNSAVGLEMTNSSASLQTFLLVNNGTHGLGVTNASYCLTLNVVIVSGLSFGIRADASGVIGIGASTTLAVSSNPGGDINLFVLSTVRNSGGTLIYGSSNCTPNTLSADGCYQNN